MKKLNVYQKNNLLTGNDLAMEIPSISNTRRAFIKIGAYDPNTGYVSKILNRDKSGLLFDLRRYEIDNCYIENDWDVSEEELVNSIHVKDIKGIEQLEAELAEHIDDFSNLDCVWKCDNPV